MEIKIIITFTVIIYSLIAGISLSRYVKQCVDSGTEPFGGSVWKALLASLSCGIFTTLIFTISLIQTVKEFIGECLKYRREQENKDQKDDDTNKD